MTAEEAKTLHQFQARVRQLIMRHNSVARQNEELQAQLKERNAQVAELEQKYNMLKMARMIEISSADTEAAQRRLAKLIREVDKCIAMLNV